MTALKAAYTVALGNQEKAIKALSLVVYLFLGKAESIATTRILRNSPHMMQMKP